MVQVQCHMETSLQHMLNMYWLHVFFVLEKSGAFIAQMVSMSFKACCLKYIHTCQKTLAAMKSDRHSYVGFYLCNTLQSFQINSMAGDRWAEFSHRSVGRVEGVQTNPIKAYKSIAIMFSQFKENFLLVLLIS